MQKSIFTLLTSILVILGLAAYTAKGHYFQKSDTTESLEVGSPQTVTCPGSYTDNVDPITCMIDVILNLPTSNCALISVSYTIGGSTTVLSAPFPSSVNIGSFGVGNFNVSWNVEDCDGLRVCNHLVLITDNTAPSITCLNIFTECSIVDEPPYADYNAFIAGGNSVSDACGINQSSFMLQSTELVAGSQPPQYCRVYKISDVNNNMATCTQKIIIEDLVPPSITCPDNITVGNNESGRRTLVSISQPDVDDNCGILSVINDYNNTDDASDDYPLGVTTVCWTVTDVNGNTNSCCQTVTIIDDTPPVMICPPNINEQCEPSDYYIYYQQYLTAGGSATDETALDTSTFTWVSDTGYDGACIDTVFRKYAIADTNMNWDTCTQLIIIEDTTPPTAACFTDVTVSLDSDGNYKPNPATLNNGSSDNCGGTLTFSFLETVCFACNLVVAGNPVEIPLIVTDECDNSSSCNVTFTVLDDMTPTITCPSNITVSAITGTCTGTVNPSLPVVDDNCTLGLIIESTLNGSTITFPAQLAVGTHSIVWTVTDVGGNSTQCTQSILVTDNQAPTINCPTAITVSTDEDVCYATNVSLGTPTLNDNCPGSTAAPSLGGMTITTSSQFSLGDNIVEWTVTDASNLTANCNQIVTVTDDQDPQIVCPDDLTIDANTGVCFATDVDLSTPSVTDNCGASAIAYLGGVAVTSSTQFDFPESTVTWIATDGAGNTVSCAQSVTVTDDEDPTITCTTPVVNTDLNQNCEVVIPYVSTTVDTDDNCGIAMTTQSPSSGTVINSSHGQMHLVVVTVTDNSGNTATCSLQVQSEDNLGPDIDCIDPRNVSISGAPDLTAESFVDHATDNCGGPITFTVSRMDGECGTGEDDDFGPEIELCCDDVGQTITVVVQVTDQHKNANTCMTTVVVNDEIDPVIIAGSLPDISISCEFPLNLSDLSVFGTLVEQGETQEDIIIIDPGNPFYPDSLAGQDGVYYDNCPGSILAVTYRDSTGMCNTGKIYRDFIVTDNGGNTATYTQTINIVDVHPFTESDITWPQAFVDYFDCNDSDPDTTITGRPFLDTDQCSLVGATYKDEVFPIADYCKLIRRTWKVLDWCQYVPNSGSTNGSWTFVQNIAIKNTVAPTINTNVCQDVTVCTQNNGCTANLTYSAAGTDDCLPVNIKWSYELDLNNNGTIDIKANGNSIQKVYDIGTHKLKWIAKDGCGNISNCSFTFDVRDCKAPTAVAMQGLALNLSPPMGMNSLWASDFNNFSSDNCTPTSQLKYSFSADVNDNLRNYNCDSLGKRNVELWVTDLAGNQSRAKTYVIVQDNFNVCGSSGKLSISGHLYTENHEMIPDVIVRLDGGETEDAHTTSAEGIYTFDGLNMDNDYALNPLKDIDHMQGITTLDLVMIQRHILGIEQLNTPYKLIAADVNKSNSITVADISELRKMILGIQTKFSNNTSWRFVDAAYEFKDGSTPWNYNQSLLYQNLDQNMSNSDFVGIKIGDVNGSAMKTNGRPTGSRTNEDMKVYTENTFIEKNKIISIPLRLDLPEKTSAIQFSLEIPNDFDYLGIESGDFKAFDAENVGYIEQNGRKYITVSYFDLQGIDINGGNNLFNLICATKISGDLGDMITMTQAITPSAGYDATLQRRDLSFDVREIQEDLLPLFGQQNEPNPFSDETSIFIGLDNESDVTISMFSGDGKMLYTSTMRYARGNHEIILTQEHFKDAKGIILCKIKTTQMEKVIKMLRIE
ncbi:MAG: HYR domain-containing protein [Saprospiraceae bacterium]